MALGLNNCKSGDYLYDAELNIQKRLAENPGDTEALGQNTALKYYRKDYAGVIKYSTVLLEETESSLIWKVRGMAFQRLERYDDALNCYLRAIDLDPLDTQASGNAQDLRAYMLKQEERRVRMVSYANKHVGRDNGGDTSLRVRR